MEYREWDMYDYILESKAAVRNIVENQDTIFEQALNYCKEKNFEQIYILGSGTSYHASVAAKKIVEDKLGVKVINMYPMEFVDNEQVFNPNTLVIGVSHAGRSSSTIRALDKARELGFLTIAMTAERERPITEHADCCVYIEIGDEFAGPKTKGYIGSIATIAMLGLKLAVQNEKIEEKEKQDLEKRFWDLSNGGKIQYVKYPIDYNLDAICILVRRAMKLGFYEGVNLSLAYCDDCGHQELEMDVCPKCGSKNLTKIERMNGYLSYSRVKGDTRLNDAKMAEIAERKSM